MIEKISDIGNIRELNEDTYGVLEGEYINVFIICDGMGGHNAGEVASAMAKDTILATMEHELNKESPVESLVSAIEVANSKIFERSTTESGGAYRVCPWCRPSCCSGARNTQSRRFCHESYRWRAFRSSGHI